MLICWLKDVIIIISVNWLNFVKLEKLQILRYSKKQLQKYEIHFIWLIVVKHLVSIHFRFKYNFSYIHKYKFINKAIVGNPRLITLLSSLHHRGLIRINFLVFMNIHQTELPNQIYSAYGNGTLQNWKLIWIINLH